MPAGESARKPAPPPGSPLALLLELEQQREGARTPVTLGVFSAYMLANALKGAMQAPELAGSSLAAGRRMIELIYAAVPEDLRSVYEDLDAISAAHDRPVADPGARYRSLTTDLVQLEQLGTGAHFELGAFTQFHVIALLQLALRSEELLGNSGLRNPIEAIARALASSFHGPLGTMIERGFHAQHDVDIDGVPAELTLMPVGFGPDAIVDVQEVVTPFCPGCGSEPGLILPGAVQAFCPSDDCRVFVWNPQNTVDEFWATATQATESGRLELTDEEVAQRAAPLAAEKSAVERERDAEHRGDAEQD